MVATAGRRSNTSSSSVPVVVPVQRPSSPMAAAADWRSILHLLPGGSNRLAILFCSGDSDDDEEEEEDHPFNGVLAVRCASFPSLTATVGDWCSFSLMVNMVAM